MHIKLGKLPARFIDPNFSRVVAFEYYDGPERGIALYPDGEGVRFVSLGDSPTRYFRAYELAVVGTGWFEQIKKTIGCESIEPSCRVWVPPASELLTALDHSVTSAVATSFYVGVGSPHLDGLIVTGVSSDQVKAIRSIVDSREAYHSVHKIIKKAAPSRTTS